MGLESGSQFLAQSLAWVQMHLIPIMIGIFVVALILKAGSYITIKFLQKFINHVEVTVTDIVYDKRGVKKKLPKGFHDLTDFILGKAFNEHYSLRHKYQRRNLDRLTTFTDRLFLINEGSQRMIEDALSHAKYYDKFENKPEFGEMTTYLVNSNPVYKRVFGIFPLEMISELLSVLPNIFVVAGIFGTFIGIMMALPGLSEIDLSNIEKTKEVMDTFLLNIVFSMNTSILGIFLSITLNLLNAFFSTDVLLEKINDTFNNAFTLLWNESRSGAKASNRGKSTKALRRAS